MTTTTTFRCLTVRPPWAFAICQGKDVENRSKPTRYRGTVAIHAGARSRWDPAGEADPLVRRAWDEAWCLPLHRNTPLMTFSAIVAAAELAGCHRTQDCTRPGGLCSPWAHRGSYHWELANVRPFTRPVPVAHGWLGLWIPSPDVARAVTKQLELA